MTDHQLWEDTAATYVLGALPDDERARFESHLATCAACRAEVDELRLAAEALPVSPPPMLPPPELKARIMAEVEREAALLASASAPPKRRRWRVSWPLGAVAALACAALLAAVVLSGDGTRTVPFESALRPASAQLEVSGDRATLVAEGLPAPPAGHVYMVWTVRPGEDPRPTSALFTPRSDGSATASVGDVDGVQSVLVNTEPAGGSPTPTTAPVLTAELS